MAPALPLEGLRVVEFQNARWRTGICRGGDGHAVESFLRRVRFGCVARRPVAQNQSAARRRAPAHTAHRAGDLRADEQAGADGEVR